MLTVGTHLERLTAPERQRLESWLDEFERSWDEQRLAEGVRRLPAAGPFRRAALVEMAKIDLERRWQGGHRVGVSYYVEAVPELGPADAVPPDLLLAEYEVRQQFGDAAGAAVLADRVPSLVDGLRQGPVRTRLWRELEARSAAETAGPFGHPGPLPAARADEPPSLPEQFGRYRILRRLGRGGMGTVYLAHDTQLDRRVALKVPHLRPGNDRDLLRRFEREARAASTLDHPNLCRVYDVGAIDGTPYLSMAYIEGRPLSDEIRARGPFPQRTAAALVRKLALALEVAHRAGVVHRDLKPGNVMLTRRGEPVVTDFGLARRDHPDDLRLTSSGQLLGTPAYMAPEQVRGDTAASGPASDVYALGVILYELLTGAPPFRGDQQAVFGQILAGEPARPSAARPDLDPALEAVCVKAMAKRPEDRFGSMQAFAAALARFLKGGAKAGADEGAARPPRRAGWLWPAAAAVGAMAVTVGLLALSGGRPADSAARPEGPSEPAVRTPSPGGEAQGTAAALRADEPVRSVSVMLTVGAGGDDLRERVALDLGLGFPLWLEPVGARSGEPPPFGAVPQQSSAAAVVRAGADATFTFAAAGDPGQDGLRTTPQLLAGVRVGDIRRVAFAGPGAGDWELAGYEVRVNDRTVAAGRPGVRPKQLLARDGAKLAEVGRAAGPLEREGADLRDLTRAKLATPDDARRLEEVEKQLAALAPEKARLEARLQGRAAWFTAPDVDLPARADGPAVRSARVKVQTRAHDGADTHNYVYFRTGGAKYLIGSPERPLTPAAGAQEFDLDLRAGPLAADGLRGWALGMLAAPQPQGDAPDRWHPQRLVVEIDGRVVYDSDQVDRDRRSLDAVRLIPPAQLDAAGAPRENRPAARELFVWEAGSGAGLDERDQPLPLPKPDESAAPRPESGPRPPVVNNVTVINGGAPNFPGEGPPWDVPADGGPQGPVVNITQNVFNFGIDPTSAGRPFQVENVRITDGVKTSDTFTVRWDLYGDEAGVHHYEVYLVQLTPEATVPGGVPDGPLVLMSGSVAPGVHTCTAAPAGLSGQPFNTNLWLRPLVRAVPADPATATGHERFGPARPAFPATALRPQPVLHPFFWRSTTLAGRPEFPPPPALPSVLGAFRRPGLVTAAWQEGQVECNGVIYDDGGPAGNIAVRTTGPGQKARVWLPTGNMLPQPPGKKRYLVANVGFEGAATGHVKVQMSFYQSPPGFPPITTGPVTTVTVPDVSLLSLEIPTVPGAHSVIARFDFDDFTGDPAHPPTLLGVRVVEKP
jgi:hypothetical protein